MGFLTVYGNENENITFKVYNHETGKEYEATNVPISFVSDAIYGNSTEPYSITITDFITQTIPLSEGWSWISVNVVNDNLSLLEQFKENISTSGIMIKSRNAFIQEPLWIGTLQEINNSEMYMVKIAAENTLSFFGLPADPATTPIVLQDGWNWIGYTPQASLPLNAALSNLNPQNGDQIKSRSDYSTYSNGIGWVGNLSNLNPSEGYKYYSTNAQTFVYPNAVSSSQLKSSSNNNILDLKWTANNNRFANNMTLTSIVLSGDEELQNDNIEIGAFCGEECRGSVQLKNFSQLVNHQYMGFLVVYGENNDVIRFRIYNHETGQEYEVNNTSLSFATDAIHGSLKEPFKIAASPTGIFKVQTESVFVYTDTSGEKLNIQHSWRSIDRLEIVDLNGRVILQEKGFTSEFVNIASLAKGMYILKIVKDNQSSVHKFIKK